MWHLFWIIISENENTVEGDQNEKAINIHSLNPYNYNFEFL